MLNLIRPLFNLLIVGLLLAGTAQAADTFSSYQVGLNSPYANAFTIVPHNTNALAFDTRAIYVGGDGDITLVTTGGDTITLIAVNAGNIYPIRANIIKTSSSATYMVGLY